MKRATLLILFMLFAPCGTSVADVITLRDGSICEGTLFAEDEEGRFFKMDGGNVFFYFKDLVGIESRTPTENERARLIRFKTERYDVTHTGESMAPFEIEVEDEYHALKDRNPDMSYDSHEKLIAEKFNLPPIIVSMILEKRYWLGEF